MTEQHYLISRFGLGVCVCAASAKLHKVIARDITIYGTFAFLLSNNLNQINIVKLKVIWIMVVSRYSYKLAIKVEEIGIVSLDPIQNLRWDLF